MINALVIDDEPYARKLLSDFIAKLPNMQLQGSYASALQALEILNHKPIDVIFLDIQMPDVTGIDFLKSLEHRPKVILTTAYAEYAVEGFELDVVDYLLKPFDFNRFLKAVNKLSQPANPPYVKDNHEKENKDLFVKDGGKWIRLPLDDIQFIQGSREYVTVHTRERKIMTLQTLKQLELDLPQEFVRIHNSFIISMNAIQSVSRQEVEIGKEQIPIGITYRKTFFERLRQFFPDRYMNEDLS
jgi:DNA-binding LytR/AlgR family response regulator